MHFSKPWEWNKPIVAFCTSDNLFLLKNLSVFFSLKRYYLCLRGKSSTPTILIFYLVKINQKLFHNSRNNFWRLFFILIFGIDSVFQNHAIEINREMYKNIDTPIEFLRNNEFLFLLNINFILQISIMTPKGI